VGISADNCLASRGDPTIVGMPSTKVSGGVYPPTVSFLTLYRPFTICAVVGVVPLAPTPTPDALAAAWEEQTRRIIAAAVGAVQRGTDDIWRVILQQAAARLHHRRRRIPWRASRSTHATPSNAAMDDNTNRIF